MQFMTVNFASYIRQFFLSFFLFLGSLLFITSLHHSVREYDYVIPFDRRLTVKWTFILCGFAETLSFVTILELPVYVCIVQVKCLKGFNQRHNRYLYLKLISRTLCLYHGMIHSFLKTHYSDVSGSRNQAWGI